MIGMEGSITSHLCKFCESIIRNAIIEHLNDNLLLNNSQHGLRQHRSCLTYLLECLEQIADHVDQGLPINAIYIGSWSKRRNLALGKEVAL